MDVYTAAVVLDCVRPSTEDPLAEREAAMPTPEEKYYDGMNTLLAPVRWIKCLVQTVIIILLLIGAGLLYPLIQHVNDGHVTFGGFVVSVLTALFIFTFFYAPSYTFVGGFICFVVFYACCFSQSFVDSLTGTGFYFFIFIFLAIGILQRYIRHRLFDPPKKPRPRQLSVFEQLNQDTRERNQQATEQAAFESEHRDTIETMREFVSSCRQPLEDALRGTSVLRGDTLVNANEAILMDTWQIWRRLEIADGKYGLDSPQRLLKALCCVVEPKFLTASDWEMLMCDLYPTLAAQDTASSLRLPGVISMLTTFDGHAGTQLASKAATTFRTVLLASANLLDDSIAVKMVVDEYLTVLKPHIKGGSGGSAESTSTSTATNSGDGLSKDYATLGVRIGATQEEAKQAYRDLAKVWHPDRFDSGDMRLKQKAEEQLKAINLAYARIQEVQPCNPPQSASRVETMPLKQALLATTVFITTISVKILDLKMMMYNGSASREDICAGIEECFAINREAVMRLEALIRRFKLELPEYPRTEIESMHSKVVEWEAKLTELAISHGFVRSC